METISADNRLIGLTDDGGDTLARLTSEVAYRCTACNTLTQFDIRQQSSQAARMRRFAEAMGTLTPYEEDYCDFDCSGCGAHVRMVYALTEVSMAHYHYYPNTLYVCPPTGGFEIKPPTRQAKQGTKRLYIVLISAVLLGIFLLLR